MVDGNADKRKNRILVVILSVLCVAIVGLTAGIVVVAKPWENGNDTETEVSDEEFLSNVNTALSNLTTGAGAEYLDGLITEYADTNLAVKLSIMKVNLYINDGNGEQALAAAAGIDEAALEGRELLDYYSARMNIEELLGNEEGYKCAYNKYWETYLEYYDGGIGGA